MLTILLRWTENSFSVHGCEHFRKENFVAVQKPKPLLLPLSKIKCGRN
jgi:hypothetical protein